MCVVRNVLEVFILDYGDILIVTDSWQTSTAVISYNDGYAYFSLFGKDCRCNLRNPLIECQEGPGWKPFEKASNLAHVLTPNIVVPERG